MTLENKWYSAVEKLSSLPFIQIFMMPCAFKNCRVVKKILITDKTILNLGFIGYFIFSDSNF